MRVSVLCAQELAPQHLQLWSRLQRADPRFSSPFFCPDFTLAVAAVRDGVRIGVLEDDGETVGFFPFHCDGQGEAEPVAGEICDLHAVVVAPGTHWDPVELIRGCGLRAWSFHGLLADQEELRPYHVETRESRYIDLAAGYESYVAERRRGGSEKIKKLEALERQLERERGPVCFRPHVTDPAALDRLIDLKSVQLNRAGSGDPFAVPWVVAFCQRLQATEMAGFSGSLSVLEAGGELAAVHLGMRSASELYYWFPAFEPAFQHYSPGLLLLLRLAAEAAAAGLQRLHLGVGEYPYKQQLMTGAIRVARGRVSVGGDE